MNGLDGEKNEVNRMSELKPLKPCPFCGGEAEICTDVGIMGKFWFIRCKKCYSRGSGIYESGRKLEPQEEHAAIMGAWEKAIEAWNRRAGEQDG